MKGFGHMEHMSGERLDKRAYKSEVEGGRYRGRPYTTWLDMVKKECNTASLELRDAEVRSMCLKH